MSQNKKRGRPPNDDILTPGEWRIVEGVRHGMTNRMIAERRGISLDAVKYHVAKALQKLGLDDRKALRHWDGISKTSALYAKEKPMNDTVMLGPIGQISRTVKDIAAARKWYGEVLGLKDLYAFGNLAFLECDGVRLFLSQSDSEEPAESIIYFRVEDIRTAYEALKVRGADFIDAPHMIHKHEDGTEEWMAFFKDNEGRTLAIMAQVKG